MRSTLATFALIATALAGTSYAATLSTPLLQGEGSLSCVVTNVGTRDARIDSTTIFNLVGGPMTPSSDNCSGTTLAPRQSCFVSRSASVVIGFCQAAGSGKLRLAVIAQDSSGVTAALAGTK